MRFYIVSTYADGPCGAYTSLREARKVVAESYGPEDHPSIIGMDVEINAETVRRMLGEEGGYATNITHYD